jgi:peptidyl-prolyl cis-trans isomerase D
MLRGIHKASSTWGGKILMALIFGVITVSFAIWGIGDIFRGFGKNYAITVGDTDIPLEQLREYYNKQLNQISRRLGKPITPDQVRALGIDRQVIGQLVAETAFDEQAQAMGLSIGNSVIAKRITGDPAFRGTNGKFDRTRFEELIREAGYNEDRFINTQRQVMLRRQIAQSFAGELHIPVIAIDAINQYQHEKRAIEYLTLGAEQAGTIATPTPEVLSKYFEDHKVLFRAPEYRKLTLLSLSPAAIAKPGSVSDADAKDYFDRHQNEFGTPEKREVKQIVYAKPEEAKAAREEIDRGKTFADLAKQRGLKPSDTDLGMVTKSAMINPAIADAAFSLKPGEISPPIKGRFGTVLVTVGKIEPGTQKSFEEVAPQIKLLIAEGRAKDRIEDLRDKIEDTRAGGATLAEAGAKLGLKVRIIDAVDRSGRGPDDKPIPNLPQKPNVVSAAYASDVGVDNDALQLPDGGYLYYSVTGITPSHARKLDEVKDRVERQWRDDEIAKRLKTKSDEIIAKLKSGMTMAQLASTDGMQLLKGNDLERGKPAGFLPDKVVEAAFSTPKDTFAATPGNKQTERYVFRVTEVKNPTLDKGSEEFKKITASLENSYADDITGQYIARLESEFGVDINQSVVNQVIGGASQ